MPKVRSIFSNADGPIIDPDDIEAFWVTVKIHKDLVFETHAGIMEFMIKQIQSRQATIEDQSQHMLQHSRISIPVLVAEVLPSDPEAQYDGAVVIATRFLEEIRKGNVTLNLERIFPALKDGNWH